MGDDASRLRWKSRPDCGSADPINGFEFESRLRAAFSFKPSLYGLHLRCLGLAFG